MILPNALIELFGRDKASECWNECFNPMLTTIFGKLTLDIVKFDKYIQTPDDLTLEKHLQALCKDKQEVYNVIIEALGVSEKEQTND